jgi:hypothetical protein
MLTGRAFRNEEAVADTLIGVLTREPDWAALPPQTPQKIRALLERCLRKDPRRRRADMGHARIEIEEVQNNAETSVAQSTKTDPSPRYAYARGGYARWIRRWHSLS